MKISELKKISKKIGLRDGDIDNIDISVIELLQRHYYFFQDQWRPEKAIDTCILHRIDFDNTDNTHICTDNTHILIERYIRVQCPKCGKKMRLVGKSCGAGNYTCGKCKINANLAIHPHDFYFHFRPLEKEKTNCPKKCGKRKSA